MMLEKIAGVCLVEKLQAVQLYELQPIYFWTPGNANAHKQQLYSRGTIQPTRKDSRGRQIQQTGLTSNDNSVC